MILVRKGFSASDHAGSLLVQNRVIVCQLRTGSLFARLELGHGFVVQNLRRQLFYGSKSRLQPTPEKSAVDDCCQNSGEILKLFPCNKFVMTFLIGFDNIFVFFGWYTIFIKVNILIFRSDNSVGGFLVFTAEPCQNIIRFKLSYYEKNFKPSNTIIKIKIKMVRLLYYVKI